MLNLSDLFRARSSATRFGRTIDLPAVSAMLKTFCHLAVPRFPLRRSGIGWAVLAASLPRRSGGIDRVRTTNGISTRSWCQSRGANTGSGGRSMQMAMYPAYWFNPGAIQRRRCAYSGDCSRPAANRVSTSPTSSAPTGPPSPSWPPGVHAPRARGIATSRGGVTPAYAEANDDHGPFQTSSQAQRFVSVHHQAATPFRPKRHRLSARCDRPARTDAFDLWHGSALELTA